MFRLDAELRVYLHREAIDFRAYAKLATMQSFCNDDRSPLVFPALRCK
jgi:hypothetical protein